MISLKGPPGLRKLTFQLNHLGPGRIPTLLAARILTALAFAVVSAQAASISVPNGSFELQLAGPPFGVDTRIDNWQKAPRPVWFDEAAIGITWDQTAGVFPNPAVGMGNRIDNMDGNQANYL